MDIRIPRLGEGVNSGTVVSILVKEGETVKKDQTILELETEKAVAPIPSSDSGVVTKIYVKEGQSIAVGQPIIAISGGGSSASVKAEPAAKEVKSAAPQPSISPAPVSAVAAQAPAPAVTAAPSGYVYESKSGVEPPASPVIRKLAKEIGLDLRKVRGSEHGGRIVLEDIRAYIQSLEQAANTRSTAGAPSVPAAAKPAAESIDFSKWGPIVKKSVSSLRRTIGQKMAESWTTIPHVTQFDEADITELMEVRKKYAAIYEKKGASLTVTSMMLKPLAAALKKYPLFNASLDEATGEIVYKDYYHLGVAVDTEAGLIVPVLRDVDKKNILELSLELAKLAEKTRQRKVSIEELQGGTFTVSNLGSIGGSYFTPIVNKPQTAILGVSRGVLKPVAVKSDVKTKSASVKIEARMMLPLALSYDHRVVDGADGARFIRELVQGLEKFNEKDLKI